MHRSVESVLIVYFALLCEATFVQAQAHTAKSSHFPGPCRPWLFPCGKGSWICTSEAAYWKFIFGPKPECPSQYPQTTDPPPGECQLVNGVCQFTEWSLKCKAWVDPFNGNKCGSMTEYVAYAKSNGAAVPAGFGQYPPPNQLCLAVNGSCTWYNPCVFWRDLCTKDSVCGSADKYYAFVYGPHPSCTVVPLGHIPTDPPGQCAVNNDHCDWFKCVSWMGWCDTSWGCGTVYDRDTYEARPPPSCPVPPPGYHPPALPGTCRFNVSSGGCAFFPNNTSPCSQPIYPPGFLTHCNALQKQWTYNSITGQCDEFYYYSCGEERDGYNVFATKEECTKMCVPQGACSKSIYPSGFDPEGCFNFLRQWTYNKNARQCVEFNYHSCGEVRDGYDVFDTEQECVDTCLHKL